MQKFDQFGISREGKIFLNGVELKTVLNYELKNLGTEVAELHLALAVEARNCTIDRKTAEQEILREQLDLLYEKSKELAKKDDIPGLKCVSEKMVEIYNALYPDQGKG